MAVSKNYGPHFGSPYNKDHNIFGSILGAPIYGSPHISRAWPKLPLQNATQDADWWCSRDPLRFQVEIVSQTLESMCRSSSSKQMGVLLAMAAGLLCAVCCSSGLLPRSLFQVTKNEAVYQIMGFLSYELVLKFLGSNPVVCLGTMSCYVRTRLRSCS